MKPEGIQIEEAISEFFHVHKQGLRDISEVAPFQWVVELPTGNKTLNIVPFVDKKDAISMWYSEDQ